MLEIDIAEPTRPIYWKPPFYFCSKSWGNAKAFISVGNIFHVFGARNNKNSCFSLEIYFLEGHKCFYVAQMLHLEKITGGENHSVTLYVCTAQVLMFLCFIMTEL